MLGTGFLFDKLSLHTPLHADMSVVLDRCHNKDRSHNRGGNVTVIVGIRAKMDHTLRLLQERQSWKNMVDGDEEDKVKGGVSASYRRRKVIIKNKSSSGD